MRIRFYFNHNKIIYALHKIYGDNGTHTVSVYLEIGHHFDLYVVIVILIHFIFCFCLDESQN